VGSKFLLGEVADRLTKLLVLIGEDEVRALLIEVWLENCGCRGHLVLLL
jgi:hypothetical protein